MEAILSVIWRYIQSTSNLSEDFKGTLWGTTEDACAGLDCHAVWL